ncbi:MAG: glycosyltransferase family 2 protein [Rhizomicrobium sp.]
MSFRLHIRFRVVTTVKLRAGHIVGLQTDHNSAHRMGGKAIVAKVGVVLLNWNGWRYTVAAAESLQSSSGVSIKTIVVDNASTDGSLDHLRDALSEAEIIANPVNSGFAGGCNVGIRRALDVGCDYIFLLNNDALVCPTTIPELVAASQRLHDKAILGSVVRFADSDEYQYFGSRYSNQSAHPVWFKAGEDGHLLAQPLIETDFALGAALFVPSDVIRRVGMFDERFYLTYEDVDLCYRARKHGIGCAMVTSSVVYHHASVSMGPESAPLQTYFLTRNELLFSEKNVRGIQLFRLYCFRLGRLFVRILRAMISGTLSNPSFKAMLLGYRDYLFRRFGECPLVIRRSTAAFLGVPGGGADTKTGVRCAGP